MIFRCGDDPPFPAGMAELHVPVHPGGAAGCGPAAAQLEAPELLWPRRPRDHDGLRLGSRLGK